jgi:hypothetical protein
MPWLQQLDLRARAICTTTSRAHRSTTSSSLGLAITSVCIGRRRADLRLRDGGAAMASLPHVAVPAEGCGSCRSDGVFTRVGGWSGGHVPRRRAAARLGWSWRRSR